jgi:tetratricopeptide (TPR) repeat protein
MKRYDEAILQYKNAIELDPTFRGSLYGIGFVHLSKGEYKTAIEYLQKAQSFTGDSLKGITPLGYAYALSGEISKAKEYLNKILEREKRDNNEDLEMDLAIVYAGLKDYDKTFYYLGKAYEKRDGGMVFLNVHPEWTKLRPDPRFQSLIKRVGLI